MMYIIPIKHEFHRSQLLVAQSNEQIYYADPNILLLDEPTNHLDLESVEWLEAFLRNQNIPMVIVSHDREFLDQVCTKIVDAEGGLCTEYQGNYSKFLQLKKCTSSSSMGQSFRILHRILSFLL